ncbi:hypothetical protein K2173_023609 [Erythroxylum novogranatense]|uniref:Uncharacterized protein n=1 Tax=Erythroxylum novogranatense TaxID=1862640 RepID=A0AAV8TRW1_9ROSI|nr:hypothetical protein K2173_023609 [Erythroxylum novogranatense]
MIFNSNTAHGASEAAMTSEPTKRKFRQPSRRTASSPVAKKAKDALSVPSEKNRDATSTSYSKVPPLTSEVDRKIQEAKNFAVSQAQRDHSMGNYRIIDSPFGNFLIPVIPTRAELGG